MTIIFDQYETEPITSYTGSYRSRIFLANSTIFTTGAFARVVLGDSATAFFSSSSLVGKKYLFSDYPKLIRTASISYLAKEGFNKFWTGIDYSEQFHDSVLGHPIYYSAANGITNSFVINEGFGYKDSDAHNVLGIPFIIPTSSIMLIVGTSSCRVQMSDEAQEEFCDNIWNYTGPFQSRYKNVLRIKEPTFKTITQGRTTTSHSLGFFSYNIYRNAANFTASFDSVSVLAFTTQSGNQSQVPTKMTWFVDSPRSGSDNSLLETFEKFNNTQYTFTLINTKVLYTAYFGFGDDIHNFPKGYEEIGYNGIQYNYVPLIRGWKFGIVDAFPRYSKAIFRYGKYGQFRDMLEQRLYSKFYNETALDAAVRVTFVTSSNAYLYAQDYVSATNPHYDPRDTGFYDYEYRCGHPFKDIEPVD